MAAADPPTPPLGVVNLGATCYMNSVVQQLFHMPGFAAQVAAVEADESSCLGHLKSLFASLEGRTSLPAGELKMLRSADPEGLFGSIVGWSGEALDPSRQQDVAEFFNLFIKNISSCECTAPAAPAPVSALAAPALAAPDVAAPASEASTKAAESLLRSALGGVLRHRLAATGDEDNLGRISGPMSTSRDEPFFYMSVPVRGHGGLEESLERAFTPETLEFDWPVLYGGTATDAAAAGRGAKAKKGRGKKGKGGKKAAEMAQQMDSFVTQKSQALLCAPPHLFFHLKRFAFDREQGKVVKLTDRFEFPSSLDMRRFADDAAALAAFDGDAVGRALGDASSWSYVLSGVIMHRGGAPSDGPASAAFPGDQTGGGHYFSYVRRRDDGGNGNGSTWYELNDTTVRSFDPVTGLAQCYGSGPDAPLEDQSAFMLVYDRVDGTGAADGSAAGEHGGGDYIEYAGAGVPPADLIGMRIMVRWANPEQWFQGRVTAFNTRNHHHRVTYDDGDVREYDLRTKTWRAI